MLQCEVFMRKPCPKCFNFVNVKKGECCPICHYEFKDDKKHSAKEETISTSITKEDDNSKLSPNLQKLYDEANKEERADITVEVEKRAEEPTDIYHQKNGRVRWVSKAVREGKVKAPKRVLEPRVGGVHIDVEKYSYFGKNRSKYIPNEKKFVYKEDGEYKIQKLEWWEIYKWADRQLAKSKIKKMVKKESVKKPERVSFWVLFSLCLFSGFLGVHNFYAGNTRRGIVQASCFALAFGFVIFLDGISFFNLYMQGLMCALPGLITVFMWVSDFVAIIFKKFRFEESRINYIKTLDLETRARLGKKYIYIV